MVTFHGKMRIGNITDFSEHTILSIDYSMASSEPKCNALFSYHYQLRESRPLNSKKSQNTNFSLLYLAPAHLFCMTLLAPFLALMVKVCGNIMQMICRGGLLDISGPNCYISPLI